MARVDYYAIEEEIAEILRANIPDITVSVESELLFSPEQTPWVGVYLDRRDAPRELQKIAAGTKTTFRLTLTIWVWCYHMEKAQAIRLRDEWLSEVEVVLMRYRTLNEKVAMSWIEGGRMPSGRIQSATPIASQTDFLAGGEIILVAEVDSTTQ
jgi:hypothetical protein